VTTPRGKTARYFPQLAKTIAARTTALSVGVIDRETLFLDRIFEVNFGPIEVRGTHLVNNQLDTVEFGDQVVGHESFIEKKLINQAGAPTGLDRHSQTQVIATLLVDEAFHLFRRRIRQRHSVGERL
jgi:hypothetical protein